MLATLIVKEQPSAEFRDILFVWDVRTESRMASNGDQLPVWLLHLLDLSTRRTTFVPCYLNLVYGRFRFVFNLLGPTPEDPQGVHISKYHRIH
jgi:hypothetical protein